MIGGSYYDSLRNCRPTVDSRAFLVDVDIQPEKGRGEQFRHSCSTFRYGSLTQLCQLGIQMRQSLEQNGLVPRIAGRLDVMHHTGPGQLQAFDLFHQFHLFLGILLKYKRGAASFSQIFLGLNVFAFPASCHVLIIQRTSSGWRHKLQIALPELSKTIPAATA